MQLRLTHRTTFLYAGPARDSFNEVRLRPVDDATQACRHFGLRTEPVAAIRDYADFYGNVVNYFEVPGTHEHLIIEAESLVETLSNAARTPVAEVPWQEIQSFPDREFYAEFLGVSPCVPDDVALRHEAREALAGGRTTVFGDAVRLAQRVFQTFSYRPNSTDVATRAIDALRQRCGVCQDFAHVTLGLCRQSGLPARYVSGYFFNDRRKAGEPEASHAWIEVFVPGHGWAGYDPTHDRAPDERYIRVAAGRDYTDIRPVSGTYRGAPTKELKVDVSVTDLAAAPA